MISKEGGACMDRRSVIYYKDELNDEFCYFSGTRLYWKIELD